MIRLAMSILVISLLAACTPASNDYECEPQPATPRAIVDSTIPISPKWAIQNIPVENFFSNHTMIASDNDSIFLVSTACDSIFALDWNTGTLQWQTITAMNSGVNNQPSHITFDSNHNRLYVSAIRSLYALDSQNGEIIWFQWSSRMAHNGHHIVILNDGQLVVEDVNYYVDPDTGDFTEEYGASIPRVTVPTLVTGYALASNVIFDEDIIHYLDASAALHTQDLDSQTIINSVYFDPPEYTEAVFQGSDRIGGSWITMNKSYVAIYFQDTDMLAVYELAE